LLNFSQITRDNMACVVPFFSYQTERICDLTPGCVFMWRSFFDTRYAIVEDSLVLMHSLQDGTWAFTLPMGQGPVSPALNAVAEYARAKGMPLVFTCLTGSGMTLLETHFDGAFRCEQSPDWSDYLYRKEDLVELKGKKYHGQRNHINRIAKEFGGHRYVPFAQDNLWKAQAFMESYIAQAPEKSPLFELEARMTVELLENYFAMPLVGGYLEIAGELAAFAVGETIGDTLYVHVEKALRKYPGAYAAINQAFAQANAGENIAFINREEDLGDPGLRAAKESYHPFFKVEKFLCEVMV